VTRRFFIALSKLLILAAFALAGWGGLIWMVHSLPWWLSLAFALLVAGAVLGGIVEERRG
jgi:hypothetical protein